MMHEVDDRHDQERFGMGRFGPPSGMRHAFESSQSMAGGDSIFSATLSTIKVK